MTNTILSSTFFITLLMAIGLFFFIRASVKDRTETVQLFSKQPETTLRPQVQQYFLQRAYEVKDLDTEQDQVTFTGFVRPSIFLALFLTLLAATGMLCIALILAQLFPQIANVFLGLLLLSPLAGVFYWKQAGRPEQVVLRMDPLPETLPSTNKFADIESCLTVVAHRDEVIQLQRSLGLKKIEVELG